MSSALCWDCNINIYLFIYLFTVQNCGPRKSADCAQWRKLSALKTNFFAEITSCRQTSWHLAVPRGLDSASHSILQSSSPLLPTFSNPQTTAVSPQNSNLPVLPPLSLTSKLTPEENNLHFLQPLRTYSRRSSSSTPIQTPLPIHMDGPSTSSPICPKSYTSSSQHT